jgi:general secretion pathway protein E
LDQVSLLTAKFNVGAEDVQKALQFQQRNGGRLEQVLIRMGAFPSEMLPQYYAEVYGIPLLSEEQFTQYKADTTWVELCRNKLGPALINEFIAQSWLPVYQLNAQGDERLQLLSPDPANIAGTELIRGLDAQVKISLLLLSEDQFQALKACFDDTHQNSDTFDLSLLEEDRLRELASEAPTVNLLNNLIAKGLRRRASDMHIEPWKNRGRVRYRIDGVLQEADQIPLSLLLPIITRLKLLSKMDIAEKRRPQDGKIEFRVDGRNVDIRVSALPVGEGESIVMRFLLQDALSYDIKKLGIEPDIESFILQDLNTTSGVILMTGPTGSGKTTSLYSFLLRRNSPEVKIITIEDPVEYQLDGINQVQVQPDIGYSFANALRSVVRQDPDIIMVGEIRDHETAGIALQSALTGHLVFSTLHTNDAASAYTRLLDLGVEPFLLSAAVKVVLAQRLVRKLCPHCSVPDPQAFETLKQLDLDWLINRLNLTPNFRKHQGCEQCGYTGYVGRVAIIEYLKCDDFIKQHLGQADFLSVATKHNRDKGFRSLLEDGAVKAIKGQTCFAEVLRVAG